MSHAHMGDITWQSPRSLKGTLTIKRVKTTPSPVGDKLNTRTLLVVLECLKDRAFHIRLFT